MQLICTLATSLFYTLPTYMFSPLFVSEPVQLSSSNDNWNIVLLVSINEFCPTDGMAVNARNSICHFLPVSVKGICIIQFIPTMFVAQLYNYLFSIDIDKITRLTNMNNVL